MAGFCFVIVLFIRNYTLKRKVVRTGQPVQEKSEDEGAKTAAPGINSDAGEADADLEKGRVVSEEVDGVSEETGTGGDTVGPKAKNEGTLDTVVEEKRAEVRLADV